MADEESLGLFAGCLISIVQNKALSAERANKVRGSLFRPFVDLDLD